MRLRKKGLRPKHPVVIVPGGLGFFRVSFALPFAAPWNASQQMQFCMCNSALNSFKGCVTSSCHLGAGGSCRRSTLQLTAANSSPRLPVPTPLAADCRQGTSRTSLSPPTSLGIRTRPHLNDPPRPGPAAGFVTTGLELWASKPCAAKHFRQRLWGTLNMPQAILSDARCWVAHMGLNQVLSLPSL